MMTISDFVEKLQAYERPLVFNPWRDYDEQYDISPEAPQIRRRQR